MIKGLAPAFCRSLTVKSCHLAILKNLSDYCFTTRVVSTLSVYCSRTV